MDAQRHLLARQCNYGPQRSEGEPLCQTKDMCNKLICKYCHNFRPRTVFNVGIEPGGYNEDDDVTNKNIPVAFTKAR